MMGGGGGYGGGYSRSRSGSFSSYGGGRPISRHASPIPGMGMGVPYAGSGSPIAMGGSLPMGGGMPIGGGVPMGGVGYAGSYNGDPYAGNSLYPTAYDGRRSRSHSRSHSHHRDRSRSRSRHRPEVITLAPSGGGYPVAQPGYSSYGGAGGGMQSFNAGYAGSAYQTPMVLREDESRGRRHRSGHGRSRSSSEYYAPGYSASYGSSRY